MISDHAIIVSQELKASREQIWKALTDKDEMRQWYFENIPDFEPVVGYTTAFPVVSGDKTFTHLWEVLEVIPQERITYSWTFSEYEGYGKVTFVIQETEEGSSITVINEGLETFPQDIPEFKPESCRGGWEYFVQGRLRIFLDGE